MRYVFQFDNLKLVSFFAYLSGIIIYMQTINIIMDREYRKNIHHLSYMFLFLQ